MNTECLTQPGTELGGRYGGRVGMEGWKQTCFHWMVRNWAGVGRRGKGFPGQDPAKDVAISLRAGLYRAPWLAARLSDFLPSRKPQREVRWEPRSPISLESHRSSLLGCLPVRGPLGAQIRRNQQVTQ